MGIVHLGFKHHHAHDGELFAYICSTHNPRKVLTMRTILARFMLFAALVMAPLVCAGCGEAEAASSPHGLQARINDACVVHFRRDSFLQPIAEESIEDRAGALEGWFMGTGDGLLFIEGKDRENAYAIPRRGVLVLEFPKVNW